MLFKLFAIAQNTFHETVRQPIFHILLWIAAGLLFISPSLAAYSLEKGSDIKVVKDVGLSTLMLYGLLTSVFSAVGVITREIESRTVLTVVSKPVGRPTFLVGKFLGVAVAVAVGYLFLTLVFLMTIRHGVLESVSQKADQPVLIFGLGAVFASLLAALWCNYVYGWNYPTTLLAWVVPLGLVAVACTLCISPKWAIQSPLHDFGDGQLLYAVSCAFSGVLILIAFAVALATRFSQVLTLILCAGVFLLGLLSDYYFGQYRDDGFGYALLYQSVPNFQFFWLGDPLVQGTTIPIWQVLIVMAYASLYALGIVLLGVAMFQKREVG